MTSTPNDVDEEILVATTDADERTQDAAPVVAGKKEGAGTLVVHQVFRARFTRDAVDDLYKRVPITKDAAGNVTGFIGSHETAGPDTPWMNRFEAIVRMENPKMASGLLCFEPDGANDGGATDGFHCHLMFKMRGRSTDRTDIRDWFDTHQVYDMESHSFTQTPPEQSVSKQVLYQTSPKRTDFYKYRIGYALKASRQAYEHGLVPIDSSAGSLPVGSKSPWFHLPASNEDAFPYMCWGTFNAVLGTSPHLDPYKDPSQFSEPGSWLKAYLAWQFTENTRRLKRRRVEAECLLTGASGEGVLDAGDNADVIELALVDLINDQTIRNYPVGCTLKLTQVYRLLNTQRHRRAAVMWRGLHKVADREILLQRAAEVGDLFHDRPVQIV